MHYVLAPRPSAARADRIHNEAVLEVRRFTIDSIFAGRELVYRMDEQRYESDFYQEFLASPTAMIRDAARNWFAQSGLFTRVADPGSYLEPTFALEANITALYGDVREKGTVRAVVELRVFFLKVRGSRDPMIVHSKTYSATCDTASPNAAGLVAAYDTCLEEILTDLETDIAAAL
jgi:cholesterol transport system auxiliary component